VCVLEDARLLRLDWDCWVLFCWRRWLFIVQFFDFQYVLIHSIDSARLSLMPHEAG